MECSTSGLQPRGVASALKSCTSMHEHTRTVPCTPHCQSRVMTGAEICAQTITVRVMHAGFPPNPSPSIWATTSAFSRLESCQKKQSNNALRNYWLAASVLFASSLQMYPLHRSYQYCSGLEKRAKDLNCATCSIHRTTPGWNVSLLAMKRRIKIWKTIW